MNWFCEETYSREVGGNYRSWHMESTSIPVGLQTGRPLYFKLQSSRDWVDWMSYAADVLLTSIRESKLERLSGKTIKCGNGQLAGSHWHVLLMWKQMHRLAYWIRAGRKVGKWLASSVATKRNKDIVYIKDVPAQQMKFLKAAIFPRHELHLERMEYYKLTQHDPARYE